MPYSNLPDDPEIQAKMERCVKKVQAQGNDKKKAIAICYESITKEAGMDEKEAGQIPARFITLKDASGALRWVLISSSAYKDQDGEIVSKKALKEDVARADAEGNRGPLRWWHVDGLDIGDCDFNAVHGRMLVESGTFKEQAIGAAIAAHADTLGASIGFYHPADEPDRDGVFHSIRRFERSLLPKGKASNLFTSLTVKEETTMNQAKLEEFRQLLGNDELAAKYLKAATEKDIAAQAAGVAFKETTVLTQEAATGLLELIGLAFKQGPVTDAAPAAPEDNPLAEFIDEEDTEEKPEGDAKPATPKPAPPAPLPEVDTDAIKQAFGAIVKEQVAAALKEQAATLAVSQKAADERLGKIEKVLGSTARKVKELAGEQPRALANGYRASAADDSVIAEATKEKTPQAVVEESLSTWDKWIRTQGNGQG